MKFTIKFNPIGKRVVENRPRLLLDIARGAGVSLKSLCGGKGRCGKCKVIINPAEDVIAAERKHLTQDEIEEGYRLACCKTVSRDTEVYVPPSSISEEQKLEIAGREIEIEPLPPVKKFHLTLSQPTLSDLLPDLERVKGRLKKEHNVEVGRVDFQALSMAGPILRESDWSVTTIVRGDEIIGVESGDKVQESIGIAIDLGTTKIAFYLVDFLTGKSLNIFGIMNPQTAYGEDVLSRIHYAGIGRTNLERLKGEARKAINTGIRKICRESGLRPGNILEATLVGNTAMQHIFLGLPVKQLGVAPFIMATNEPIEVKGREVGLEIYPRGYVYLPPPIAGFIGSDHLAMLIASEIESKEGNIIAIDIGTNTEIALKTGKKIISCSCASGPAFEGAHIRHGMRAAPGAIERVNIDSKSLTVRFSTIRNRSPVGLCGSGILDAISEMLKIGIIDPSGKIVSGYKGVRKSKGRKSLEFLVAREGKGEVTITQEDVSEIQLAKGAIRTGIDILLEETGLRSDDIDEVIVAGAFGTYIDPLNAVRIGMFPEISIGKFTQIGNAAGIGAKAILLSKKLREEANRLASKIEYLELATHSNFSEHFTDAIRFPKIR